MMDYVRSPRLQQVGYWTIVLVILLFSAGLISYRIGEPLWEKGHHGFHMSEYPHNAKNYLRFGYLQTKLGLVENFGDTIPSGAFRYRVDHGFVTPFLISIAYRMFGLHDWATRLMPVFLTMGMIVITFVLASRLFNKRWISLFALFFCGLSPLILYYGRMPAPHILASCFAFLSFLFYWLWFQTKRYRFLWGLFVVLILGAHTDWIIYFTIGPMVIHYLLFWKERRSWLLIISLLISPFLLFATYLLWAYWVNGEASLQYLWNKFLFRTISSGSEGSAYIYTLREWWQLTYHRAIYWLTTPVILLSLGWLLSFLWAVMKRRASAVQGFVFILFLFGFSHNLLFSNRVFIHDFIMYFHLVSPFAIASAVSVVWLISNVMRLSRILGVATAFIICGLFLEQSIFVYQAEHYNGEILTETFEVGMALNDTISGSGRYVDAANLRNLGERRGYVIADRPYRSAGTLEETLKTITDDPGHRFEAVVVSNADRSDAALKKYLTERYPRKDVAGHSIFLLTDDGSNTLVDKPVIQTPLNLVFGDQFEYLGYEVKEVVNRAEPAGWFANYLNRHVGLLPGQRTTFQVTNYWRKLAPDSFNAQVTTHFLASREQEYQIEPRHDGLNDLYPSSQWPVGQIIREEFQLVVPQDYPSLKYDMWVGVQYETGNLAPDSKDWQIDDRNRVKVGQVDLRPSQRPMGTAAPPNPQTKAEIQIDRTLNFLGYSLETAETGIFVTTFWQKTTDTKEEYELALSLGEADSSPASIRLDLPPLRLWEPGHFYQAETTFSPFLPSGQYLLQLIVKDEQDQEQTFPLTNVHWCEPSERPILHQIGQPDGISNNISRLSPENPFEVDFDLSDRQDVDIIIGWTGRSQYDETRIQVHATNERWLTGQDKYLQTLAISAQAPTIRHITLPARLTTQGRNTVEFTVPQTAPTGWRQALATIIPDLAPLLRTSPKPYDGWIEIDFVQIVPVRSPLTPGNLDNLDQYSPEKLIDTYNFIQGTSACTHIENREGIVQAIETELFETDWSNVPLDTLVYVQSHTDLDLRDKLDPYLSARVPVNIDKILVDNNEHAKIHVLGTKETTGREVIQFDIFFEMIENLDSDYTLILYAQSGDVNALFDQAIPTSEWQPGKIYNVSFVTQAEPGVYDLSFSVQGDDDSEPLFLENRDEYIINLGQFRIR